MTTTPQLRAAWALHQARQYRCHKRCYCGRYDGTYCSDMDALWSKRINDELEAIPR